MKTHKGRRKIFIVYLWCGQIIAVRRAGRRRKKKTEKQKLLAARAWGARGM